MCRSEAYEAGRSAYHEGMDRNLIWSNKDFYQLMENEADRIALMKCFYQGWDQANADTFMPLKEG